MEEKIFLVINLSCFGDVLLTNLLCQNIKLNFPKSKVIFCTDKPFKDAASQQKDVDEVMVFDKRGKDKGLFNLLKFAFTNLYRNKIEASFVIYGNSRGLILSKLLGAKKIITGALKKTFFINTPQPKTYKLTNQQEANECLIEALTEKESQNLPIKYNADIDKEFMKEFYRENVVAVCFEANNPEKDLSIEIASEVIQKLKEDGKTVYYLGAGISASDYANQLRLNECDFIDLSNKTNIPDLAKVLKMTKGLISIDTGTMHMACAVGVPVLGIFLKVETVKKWAPKKELYKSDVIFENITAENIVNKFNDLVNNG